MPSDAPVMMITFMPVFLVVGLPKMCTPGLPVDSFTPVVFNRKAYGSTGQAVVNLARLVAKNAFTLRTLASWVNRVWLIAK